MKGTNGINLNVNTRIDRWYNNTNRYYDGILFSKERQTK